MADTAGNDVTFAIDEDGSGSVESGELSATATSDSETGEASVTFTDISGLTEGDYDVIAIKEGDNDGTESVSWPRDVSNNPSTTLTIDDTQPTAENPSPASSATVSDTTPSITLDLTEGESSINQSTIEVEIVDSSGEQLFYRLDATEAQGISFSKGTLTIDIDQSKLSELPEDDITVSVEAEDEAGNTLTGTPSWTFTVDTNPVSVDITGAPSEGDTVTDNTQTITVDVSSVSADIDTTEVAITGDGYTETLTNENTDVYTDGTFTIDAGPEGDIEALPEGEITVEATATDTDGKSNSDTLNFLVDTNGPSVESVSVNNGDLVNADNADSVPVTVTFNETVNPSTVSGEIHLDDDDTAEVTLGSAGVVFDSKSADGTSVTYLVNLNDGGDVTTDFENASAEVHFTSAADDSGNSNSELGATGTFSIDTIAPTVSENSAPDDLPTTVSGVVDFEGSFSASDTEGGELVFEIRPALSSDEEHYHELSEFDNVADFDTTHLPEGTYDLRVSVEDDDGNSDEVKKTVKVDNADPSVTYEGDAVLTGEVNISTSLDVQDNGFEEPTFYYQRYDTVSAAEDAADGLTSTDVDGFTQGDTFDVNEDSEDGAYVLVTAVSDPGYDDDTKYLTAVAESQVLEDNDLSIEVEENSNDASKLNITVTSDVELSTFNVTGTTADNFHEQSSMVHDEDAFNVSQNEDGDWEYTHVSSELRDGFHSVALENATLGQQTLSVDDETPIAQTGAAVDTGAPNVTDATVVDGDSDGLTIEVKFDEPLDSTPAADAVSAEGVDAFSSITAKEGDAGTGVLYVTFFEEFQTADAPDITFEAESVTEAAGDDSNSIATKTEIHTITLDLEKGVNVISIPAETGSVAVDEYFGGDAVEGVFAYEGDGSWASYDADAKENDLTELEGGNAYVVTVKKDTKVEINAENVPSDESKQALQAQDLSHGWNLVGAYQEGSQSIDQAFAPLPSDADWSVEKGYTGVSVTTLEAGEGYWLFTNADQAKHVPVDYDGMQSDRATVANVEMSDATEGDDDGVLSDGETVTISADVSDDSILTSVTASSYELGIHNVELTHDSGNTYTGTATVNLGDVSPDETYTVNVAAVDTSGNVGYGAGQSLATESTAPTVNSIETVDRDGDGNVDAANVVFSESIDDATLMAGDYSIAGTKIDSINPQANSQANDETIQLQLADGNEVSGTDAKDVTYTQGTTADAAGNLLGDVASGDVTEDDGAAVQVLTAEKIDSTTVELRFSEDVGTSSDGSGAISSSELSYDDGSSTEDTAESFGTGDVADNGATITITVSSGDVTQSDVDGDDAISIDSILNSAGADGSSISSQTVDIEDAE